MCASDPPHPPEAPVTTASPHDDPGRPPSRTSPGGGVDTWTLEQVHLEAKRRCPADPTRADFGTREVPVPAAALALAVAMREPPWAAVGLGATFVVMYLLSVALSVFEPIRGYRAIVLLGGNVPELVDAGEDFRLLTAAFLHAGLGHLLLNLFGLLFIGRVAEPLFGTARFLMIFLFTAIAGNLVSASVRTGGIAVGASGGILGLLAALVVYAYRSGRILPDDLRKQLAWTFVPWLVASIYMTIVSPAVDAGAHFGGLGAGTVAAFAVQSPTVNPWATRPRALLLAGITGAGVSAWLIATWVAWLARVLLA